MDTAGIDKLCQKLEKMTQEVSQNEIGIPGNAAIASLPIIMSIYKKAIELFATDATCNAILERILKNSEEGDLQTAFSSVTEDDLDILGKFAEQYAQKGDLKEVAQLYQFMTLLCPDGAPHPFPYLHLAESLSALNLDTGLQIYDFITNIFPDNPAILISAAQNYIEGERPKRAMRLLLHAKEVCEQNINTNPQLQEFIDVATPMISDLQKNLDHK